MSEVWVYAELAPSEDPGGGVRGQEGEEKGGRGETVPCLLMASGGLLAAFGDP